MWAETLGLLLLLMFCIPITVYLSVKLGTHAWLKARRQFREESYSRREGEGKNGRPTYTRQA